jgi:hypothetical protein
MKRVCAGLSSTVRSLEELSGPGKLPAGADHTSFWSALSKPDDSALKVNVLMLSDGERRAAGLVLLSKGDLASTQCSVRDHPYSDAGTAGDSLRCRVGEGARACACLTSVVEL